jgi:hypothetical protein
MPIEVGLFGLFLWGLMSERSRAGRNKWRSLIFNSLIVVLAGVAGYEAYSIYHERDTRPALPPAHQRDSLRVNGGVQIDILNGCGAAGVGQTATDFVRGLGYDVVEMKNYKNFDQDESYVIDRSGKLQTARELAAHLGIEPTNIVQELSRDYFVTASIVIGKDYRRLRPWNHQPKE